jgi:hypothetical protein
MYFKVLSFTFSEKLRTTDTHIIQGAIISYLEDDAGIRDFQNKKEYLRRHCDLRHMLLVYLAMRFICKLVLNGSDFVKTKRI